MLPQTLLPLLITCHIRKIVSGRVMLLPKLLALWPALPNSKPMGLCWNMSLSWSNNVT